MDDLDVTGRRQYEMIHDMEKTNTENTPEYREVQARELVWRSNQLDGQRIVLMDYLDGRYKSVVTPEHLSLALDTSAAPGIARQLETLGRQLYRVRLRGVFRGHEFAPGHFSLEIHSLELLPEPDYLKVTWADVYANPQKYDRARVEYTGRYVSSFESSLLDGVWLESSPYAIRRGEAQWHELSYSRGKETTVRVRGVLHTQPGTYGHMGASLFLLRADEIDFI
jgi:hypothetical protein